MQGKEGSYSGKGRAGSVVDRDGAGTDSASMQDEMVPLATVGTSWFRAPAHAAPQQAWAGQTEPRLDTPPDPVSPHWVSVPERRGMDAAVGAAAPLATVCLGSAGGSSGVGLAGAVPAPRRGANLKAEINVKK